MDSNEVELKIATHLAPKASLSPNVGLYTQLRQIAREAPDSGLYGKDLKNNLHTSEVDQWVDLAQQAGIKSISIDEYARVVNDALLFRTLLVEYNVTIADIATWAIFKQNDWDPKTYPHVARYLSYLDSLPAFKNLAIQASKAAPENKAKASSRTGAQGTKVELPGAVEGAVVTRFPPEPSGYLHIGHVKAALLNDYYATHYKGKLILRFDDTNPAKEKVEYVESIIKDLETLGVKPYRVTYTSDYFGDLLKYAEQLLKDGHGYIDTTDKETIRAERMVGTESKCRSQSVQENLKLWEEMKLGTDLGKSCVLRGKIDMQSKNKALRDPALYRSSDVPHHRIGPKYKVYPLYDFACPIVDSIEGVTHALRSSEYHDRNPLYDWVLESLKLRKPHLEDFSRLNFTNTLLSKRKLQWFVDKGKVAAWNDPRFPTIQGILRRGMTVEALREFISSQGFSKSLVLMEPEKLWAVNKKVIDPIVPRYTAIAEDGKVPFYLSDGPTDVQFKSLARHKKNPSLGNKVVAFASTVFLESADAAEIALGEEVTLMDWGNAVVDNITKDAAGKIASLHGHLNLSGNFKDTKKKLTWLADIPDNVKVTLIEYGYLITKKKLDEDDNFEDFVNEESKTEIPALGDANLRALNVGDKIQLERRGYFIVDEGYLKPDKPMVLILIPDGHTTKAQSVLTTPKEKEKETKEAKEPKAKGKGK